jgi:carbonic anhydrase
VLVGCCDSRVDPAIITQCDPGDLFVIRNVANLVAPYHPDGMQHGVSAALEYAIQVLKVENIIILGHSKCGGM